MIRRQKGRLCSKQSGDAHNKDGRAFANATQHGLTDHNPRICWGSTPTSVLEKLMAGGTVRLLKEIRERQVGKDKTSKQESGWKWTPVWHMSCVADRRFEMSAALNGVIQRGLSTMAAQCITASSLTKDTAITLTHAGRWELQDGSHSTFSHNHC